MQDTHMSDALLRRIVARLRAAGMPALGVMFALLMSLFSALPGYAATRSSEGYHLARVAVIHVPGAPKTGWCFDLGAIGPGPAYLLANASQSELTLANDSTDTLAGSIGQGDFTGEAGCHQFDFANMGPEGVLVRHGEVWVGNGDSHVEVFSFLTHQRLFNIWTGGVNRADEMAVGAGLLVVTNPDDPTPFLTFLSLSTKTIVKQLFFPQATAGLEQPAWYHGRFYLSVPATTQNPGGEVDMIDPGTYAITPIPVSDCTPAGLSINSQGEAAVGCADGAQVLLDLKTRRILARVPVSYVDVVAHLGDHFFFASYGSAPGQQPAQKPQLFVSDSQGHPLARVFTTSVSHTVTTDPTNGHILVPVDGGDILVFREVQ
jgi:hypothetical protein